LDSQILAHRITEFIFSKKGYDVKIMDLRNVTNIADYFVICSAASDTQVKAISDEIDKQLSEQGIKCWHIEGYNTLNWVLMDYFDVVVHIFRSESRNFYNLEKLWGDAPTESVEDKPIEVVTEEKPKKPRAKRKPKEEDNNQEQD